MFDFILYQKLQYYNNDLTINTALLLTVNSHGVYFNTVAGLVRVLLCGSRSQSYWQRLKRTTSMWGHHEHSGGNCSPPVVGLSARQVSCLIQNVNGFKIYLFRLLQKISIWGNQLLASSTKLGQYLNFSLGAKTHLYTYLKNLSLKKSFFYSISLFLRNS